MPPQCPPKPSADCAPGTFARVWLVRLRNARNGDENKVFALKILRKVDGMRPALPTLLSRAPANTTTAVIRLKQVEHVRNERNVLAGVAGHPFITTMVASFQDHDSLYMLVGTHGLTDLHTPVADNMHPAGVLPRR